MNDTSTTAPPGADNPPERRTCRSCTAEKVVTPATWPHRKGREGRYQAAGTICLECEKARKAKYEATRNDIVRKLTPDVSAPKGATKTDDKRKAKLDVDAALKAGAIALNQVAPSVMARMMTYLDDELSEHHQWALEFFAQRIVPRKLYEELGGQAAGIGALNDKRPTFIVNVLPVAAPAQAGSTYEHEYAALPAPAVEEAEVPSTAG